MQSHVIIEENLLINSTKLKTPVINSKGATNHLQWQSWLLYSFLQFIKHLVLPIGGNHDHDYKNASLSFDKSEQTLRNYARGQVFHGLYFPLFRHILHSEKRNIFPCFSTNTPSNILAPTIHYNDTSKHVPASGEVTTFSNAEYFIVKILEKI